MVDRIFDNIVKTLEFSARKLGMSYKEINVYGAGLWIIITIGLTLKAFRRKTLA